MFSRLKAAAFAIMAGMAITSAASAQTFTGSTMGCFGAGCSPVSGTSNTAGGNLQFASSNFSGTASNGFLAIGGLGSGNNNFGIFTLSSAPSNYSTAFTLAVNFTMPTSTPSGTQFTALLMGSVGTNASGGIEVDFDNTPQLFASTSGPFTLRVNDLSVNGGQSNNVSGTIRAVPGPVVGAGIPVLLGLAGVVLFRRRKQTV